ncbi:hypothetical protein [Vitiosangium sp. GDMCC 1.1324]|uniref:hypothetical protein n=1 Tax=Vitiosangium sp. (strain GDMCC 1.1324) TaxID=2138576 RepID=UPI000D35D63A|nr:hypothetical protein [Vitiosangium sp. GDMCC 1.1324]PTL85543.1 hypothetical protein DAT35_02165 [Vitiosangium sp. GDMCC 1.1324]
MSPVLRAGSLFEHMRHICERPRMFAPDFTLDHLHLYIQGYEDARGDEDLPSQYHHFREWIYKQHPTWRDSPEWWARHVFKANSGDLDRTLDDIIRLLDQFLATDGAEFVHFPVRQTQED